MRKIQDIEKQITDIQNQIAGVDARRNEAEIKLEDARRAYSASIVDADADVDVEHQKRVMELSVRSDALDGAKGLLESDLEKAQNEKSIVELYRSEGTRHNDQMALVESSIATINSDLPKLAALLDRLSDTIRKAVSGVENACSGLDSVEKGLDSTLSLESFLSGHLQGCGDEDRKEVLDNIGEDLRDSVGSLDITETGNLAELQGLVESLNHWRALVTTFDGIGLIRNPKKLFKPVTRRPSTQRISPPPKVHSTDEPTTRREFPIPSRLTTKPLIADAIREPKRPLYAGM
jgi:hypothetical protein